MYEMGLRAASEGCRGEVPRADPDIPPQGVVLALFSYTHRPVCSAAHGPAGLWAENPIPQNSFVWVLLKMGSRPQTAKIAAQKARQQDQSEGSRSEAQYSDYYHCLGPLNRLHCLLLSHIPTGQVAVARTGRRAYEQKAQSRKTHLYEVG